MIWRSGTAVPGRRWEVRCLLERAFRLRRKDIRIFCDFLAETTELYWNLELVACPARLLWVLLRQGPALLRIYEQQKNQKAV